MPITSSRTCEEGEVREVAAAGIDSEGRRSYAEGDIQFLGWQGSAREYVCAERGRKVYPGDGRDARAFCFEDDAYAAQVVGGVDTDRVS